MFGLVGFVCVGSMCWCARPVYKGNIKPMTMVDHWQKNNHQNVKTDTGEEKCHALYSKNIALRLYIDSLNGKKKRREKQKLSLKTSHTAVIPAQIFNIKTRPQGCVFGKLPTNKAPTAETKNKTKIPSHCILLYKLTV